MTPSTVPGGLRIARIFGVPIYVHPSWVVIFGLITWTLATGYFPARNPDLPAASYWGKGLIASLLFFLSILLHELGHAVMAQRNGIRIRSITLFIFGGVAQMEKDPPDGATEFRIAVVGPIVSLGLAGVFYAVSTLDIVGEGARGVSRYLALINLVLAVFNLVPAFPLDGGRLLRGLVWQKTDKARATRIASGAGTFFAYFLIVSGVFHLVGGAPLAGVWYVLIGWFLKEAAAGAYQGARLDETLRGLTVRDAMITDVATLPSEISVAEAAREFFARTGYGGYPVVRGEQVVGLLGLRDVLRVPAEEREGLSVQAAMAPLGDAVVIGPATPLREAVARMAAGGVGRLVVMDRGQLAGYLTLGTVMRHIRVREQLAA